MLGCLNCTGETLTATLDVLGPGRGLRAGGAQDPFAERHDQAGLLGDRDELAGGISAALRMLPAHQRLEAGEPAVAELELGLIVELELVRAQRKAQVALQRRGAPAARASMAGSKKRKVLRPSSLAR